MILEKKRRRNAKGSRTRTARVDDPIGLGWVTADQFGDGSPTLKVRLPKGMAETVVELLEQNRLLDHAECVLAWLYDLYRKIRCRKSKRETYIPYSRRPQKGQRQVGRVYIEDFVPRNIVTKLLGNTNGKKPGVLAPVVESDGRWQRPGNGHGKQVKCLYYRFKSAWWEDGHSPETWVLDGGKFRAVAAKVAVVQRAKADAVVNNLATTNDGCRTTWESVKQLRIVTDLPPKYQHHPFRDFFDGEDAGFLIRCEQGRLFHPGVSIPRACRYAMRFDHHRDEPLGICDVSAAQPLIVAWLARQVEIGVIPANHQRPRHTHNQTPQPLPGMYRGGANHYLSPGFEAKANELLTGQMNWFQKVSRDCYQRLYYKRFLPVLERLRVEGETGVVPFTEGKVGRVKKLWMGGVYGHCQVPYHPWDDHQLIRAMAMVYPEMYAIIREMVYHTPHGNLARLAQRYESFVMVDRVAPRLSHQFSDQPWFLIHDAVCCLESFLQVVERVMREEWTAAFGVVPGLSTNVCKPLPGVDRRSVGSGLSR